MKISALFSTATLFAFVARGGIQANLRQYCPYDNVANDDTYVRWAKVPEDDWYWGDDWAEWEKNGTSPIDKSAGDVYPAGFQAFNLGWYNQPPICMLVPGSHDKKVEILVESDTKNTNLCIHDASDTTVDLNNAGSVSNCGMGKLYACFTAATSDENTLGDGNVGENFGFYVFCNGQGCEQTDITVRIRIRLSDLSWDDGKTDTENDLEHWCEHERGTTQDDVDLEEGGHLYYTYPSDLIPDNPSKMPFHIKKLKYGSSTSMTRPNLWLALLAATGLAALL